MSIKFYETPEDRNRERGVADRLALAWGVEMVQMPEHTWYDFSAIKDGVIMGYVEIKTRRNAHDDFETYMISSLKVQKGLMAVQTLGVKFILAVQWEDKLRWLDVANSEFYLQVGGTTKRNDPRDVEVMAHFKINQFRDVKV